MGIFTFSRHWVYLISTRPPPECKALWRRFRPGTCCLAELHSHRSVPLPTTPFVDPLCCFLRISAGCRPPAHHSAYHLSHALSRRDIDGPGRPHQLTADWANDSVIRRSVACELPDHHRFLDPERTAFLIDALCTKIHGSLLDSDGSAGFDHRFFHRLLTLVTVSSIIG